MLSFEDILYIVEVVPNFYNVRLKPLDHLTISAVSSYERALHCVKEFVLNYKTPENLVNEMRELVREDTYKDLVYRNKLWEGVPQSVKDDVYRVVEEAYHDPEYRTREKFKSANLRIAEQEEVVKQQEVIKKILVFPKKVPKVDNPVKKRGIFAPLF